MKSLSLRCWSRTLFGLLMSATLLACSSENHMTQKDIEDTLLTCEQMFGLEKCQ